jgi:uncharacterized protein (UPF0335 family)
MPSDSPAIATGSNVTDEAIAAAVAQWMRQERVISEERGVLGAMAKRLKADGLDVKAIKATAKARKLDAGEVLAHEKNRLRYFALSNIPLTQANLFEGWSLPTGTGPAKMTIDLWSVEDEGYRAGRHGVDIGENPHQPGSEYHVVWLREWHKGQASIAREMGPEVEQAPTTRRRRARQPRIPGTEPVQRRPANGEHQPAAD